MSNEKETTAGNEAQTPEAKAAEARNVYLREFITRAENLMEDFMTHWRIDRSLNGTDRRRLTGTGVRNNGFIDKAFDIARENPAFLPAHFDDYLLRWNMEELEELRQLMLVLQQFTQLATSAHMIQADVCYRDALRIYASLKEQARNRVPGAEALFRALFTFFAKSRRNPNEEPTQEEIERDVHALLHGTKDGEIVIRHESPEHAADVHSGKSAFKGPVEE